MRLATSGVRSPEAARRLGIDGAEVYRLLFAGELVGGPARDGLVYFDEASLAAYVERYGFGHVPSTVSSPVRDETEQTRGRSGIADAQGASSDSDAPLA
jgi:hypothetical protein